MEHTSRALTSQQISRRKEGESEGESKAKKEDSVQLTMATNLLSDCGDAVQCVSQTGGLVGLRRDWENQAV